MREREESEERVIRLEVVTNHGVNCTNGRNEVRMLDDNTLGRARGARSVHDACHIIAGRNAAFRRFEGLPTAEFAQGIEGEYGHTLA